MEVSRCTLSRIICYRGFAYVTTYSTCLENVIELVSDNFPTQVRDSDITAEVVEQLKQTGPKIANIIEANGEGDAGMLSALFKVRGLTAAVSKVQNFSMH